MPKTMTTRYQVAFNDPSDLPGLLDMLRYDGARVIAWDRLEGPGGPRGARYTVTLEAERCEEARWRSMGLRPERVF